MNSNNNEIAIGVGALRDRPGYVNILKGMELAVERLNEEPGLQFRIVQAPESARGAVEIAAAHVANREILAVVGHPESGLSLLAAPVYAATNQNGRNALVAVSPTASSPALSGISNWFFRVAPSDASGAKDVARFVADSLEFKSAAIVYRNDSYGRDWTQAFSNEWLSLGGNISVRDPYLTGETDWSVYAANIALKKPDAVLFPGDAEDAIEFLRALKKTGSKAAFIGGDGTEGIAQYPEFAGSRYVSFFRADQAITAEAKLFLQNWSRVSSERPDMFAAMSYDATLAIGMAARNAENRDRAGIRNALKNVAIDGVAGKIAFDPISNDVVGRSIVLSTVPGHLP